MASRRGTGSRRVRHQVARERASTADGRRGRGEEAANAQANPIATGRARAARRLRGRARPPRRRSPRAGEAAPGPRSGPGTAPIATGNARGVAAHAVTTARSGAADGERGATCVASGARSDRGERAERRPAESEAARKRPATVSATSPTTAAAAGDSPRCGDLGDPAETAGGVGARIARGECSAKACPRSPPERRRPRPRAVGARVAPRSRRSRLALQATSARNVAAGGARANPAAVPWIPRAPASISA